MMKRHGRRAKRPGAAHSTGLKVLFCLVLLATVAGTIFWTARLGLSWLRSTQFLALKDVTVQCSEKPIKQWAFDQLQGLVGRNILAIDKAEVRTNLLKNPWISGVEIDLSPPHGINVEIKTRRAVAFIKKGKKVILVDSNGEMFSPDKGVSTSKLFELKGHLERPSMEKFSRFIGLVDRYGKILCHKNIASVTMGDKTMTVVTRSNAIPLIFQLNVPLGLQMKRAEAILYHLYSSGKYKYVKRVDLWIAKDKAIASLKKKV